MRLTGMNRASFAALFAVGAVLTLPLAGRSMEAQTSAPPNTGNTFKDTTPVRPPAGAKVAIYEFEDLECPACARAYPMVHQAADHYKIPIVRHDFPLKMHIWSFDAAVDARYIQDKISPKVAEEYRGAVFAAQAGIANKDDLGTFTRKFFQSHGGQMPFVVDPDGSLAKEVRVDYDLGVKVGLSQTPTIFVCTQTRWIQVTDPTQLYQTIELAESQANAAPPSVAAKKKTVAAK